MRDALTEIVRKAVVSRGGPTEADERLNEALRRVQKKIGVTAGDVAGQMFSGDDEMRAINAIRHGDARQFKGMLCRYLKAERGYASSAQGVRIAALAKSCLATQIRGLRKKSRRSRR